MRARTRIEARHRLSGTLHALLHRLMARASLAAKALLKVCWCH